MWSNIRFLPLTALLAIIMVGLALLAGTGDIEAIPAIAAGLRVHPWRRGGQSTALANAL